MYNTICCTGSRRIVPSRIFAHHEILSSTITKDFCKFCFAQSSSQSQLPICQQNIALEKHFIPVFLNKLIFKKTCDPSFHQIVCEEQHKESITLSLLIWLSTIILSYYFVAECISASLIYVEATSTFAVYNLTQIHEQKTQRNHVLPTCTYEIYLCENAAGRYPLASFINFMAWPVHLHRVMIN